MNTLLYLTKPKKMSSSCCSHTGDKDILAVILK